jgi:hypothetical protein
MGSFFLITLVCVVQGREQKKDKQNHHKFPTALSLCVCLLSLLDLYLIAADTLLVSRAPTNYSLYSVAIYLLL